MFSPWRDESDVLSHVRSTEKTWQCRELAEGLALHHVRRGVETDHVITAKMMTHDKGQQSAMITE